MADVFQRVRMEPQDDGSMCIGVGIEDPDALPDKNGDRQILTAQWAYCRASAPHVHGWDSCDIVGLFGARTKDKNGNDIDGTSKKDELTALKTRILNKRNAPLVTPNFPKKTIQNEKGEDTQIDDKKLTSL